MTNIVRGTIVIPFSAEVADGVKTQEQLLEHFDRFEWQFADFAQHEDTASVMTWESQSRVMVHEVIPGRTMDDEFVEHP